MRLRVMLDWSSIEVFVEGGILTITDQIFPTKPFDQVHIKSDGQLEISGEIKELSSIW